MRVIAHRGFAGVAPENTIAAARNAVSLGADTIEFDVVATADGTPVVFHDSRLDDAGESRGLTDASGRVCETDTTTVTSATVLDSGQTVPALADFISAVPAGVGLNVELKNPGRNDLCPGPLKQKHRRARREVWAPFVDRVLDVLAGVDNAVLFSSFYEGSLEAVRDYRPTARVAPLSDDFAAARRMARHLDADAIHPSLSGLRDADATRSLDRPCNVWTVRDWQHAATARRLGADGLITDYPGLLDWPTDSRTSE
ncbi:glycerophosphodiester phosphodiesterase [Halocalculus aciditolerans]|uniref:Glycerophosphoryl diester phosphodiesterase n=1 Tax=Halocalculus aciditolerans TaxID=1383812 RepID=A0A830FP13_9EURY|nr:glycerophosphodiester phosphodiesterase [Halocalculus aciditolerans]GGL66325.1 glycerophosphoryl diester phosphodiesterase [Halocalculus aciditolerans]